MSKDGRQAQRAPATPRTRTRLTCSRPGRRRVLAAGERLGGLPRGLGRETAATAAIDKERRSSVFSHRRDQVRARTTKDRSLAGATASPNVTNLSAAGNFVTFRAIV